MRGTAPGHSVWRGVNKAPGTAPQGSHTMGLPLRSCSLFSPHTNATEQKVVPPMAKIPERWAPLCPYATRHRAAWLLCLSCAYQSKDSLVGAFCCPPAGTPLSQYLGQVPHSPLSRYTCPCNHFHHRTYLAMLSPSEHIKKSKGRSMVKTALVETRSQICPNAKKYFYMAKHALIISI